MSPILPPSDGAVFISDLSVRYDGSTALDGVTARIPRGSMTAIIGPNGAGKSTLLKAVLGLEPSSGTALVFGRPVAEGMHRIAYVPQRAAVDWGFPVRVIDVVLMGAYRQTGLLGRVTPELRQHAQTCLERVGMEAFAARQIGALSGGQQQRVFLARALAQKAELYVLDEPFAGVDVATEAALISVLKSLRDEGATIIAVHHDLSTVAAYFDRVLMLNRRTVAEGPVATTFTPQIIGQTYGGTMMMAASA
jgi:manganese/zinc/iron transport system ATP- binding protein